jgi:Ca-activated chloride channel homolog
MEHFSEFIQASNPSNEYFVISFSAQPQLLAEGVKGNEAIAAVSSLLSSTKPKGNTAFYDASHFGIEKVMQGKYLKKAILVFSDGADNASKYNFDDLRRLIKETAVMLFAIHIPVAGYWESTQTKDLVDLASINGSWAYFPNNRKELIAVFNMFAARLRNQYTLGFIPDNHAAGDKWHRLKVEVKLPSDSPVKRKEMVVQSRTGYYAAQ